MSGKTKTSSSAWRPISTKQARVAIVSSVKRSFSLKQPLEMERRSPMALECDQCSQKFKLQIALNQHLKKCHPSLEQETVFGPYYDCDECGKELKSETSLKDHIRLVHKAKKKFQCNRCDKAFKAARELRIHIETVHEKRRDFKCPSCQKTFG